jgi:NhaP-type Na+/H+ or K+/H+ antiporter
MLLISGIFLGIHYEGLGLLGDSIKLISEASPSSILAIFLPVLIFESSFKTEWHIFKKLAGQSLILGILSTLVSATSIMLLVKLFLDS